jgi:hypothetical protein
MSSNAGMNAALAIETTPLASASQLLVIPVRYVAQGEVVHATSTAVSINDVRVRSARPPERGLVIGLKLYFPAGGVVSRGAVVAEATDGDFRAEFNDSDELASQRLSEVLWRREMSLRPYPRFHTQLKATLRERERPKSEGFVSNISRSGAFVRLESLPAKGSVVELDVTFPGDGVHSVHAYVVHLAERRGVGVQFIGASDSFSSKLEDYLAELAR